MKIEEIISCILKKVFKTFQFDFRGYRTRNNMDVFKKIEMHVLIHVLI